MSIKDFYDLKPGDEVKLVLFIGQGMKTSITKLILSIKGNKVFLNDNSYFIHAYTECSYHPKNKNYSKVDVYTSKVIHHDT